jgi:uroporphyrinogen-III decarboxylase
MQDILEREPKTQPKPEQREGTVARTIEQQTAKLPSDTFLWAAIGSIGVSLIMMAAGEEKKANFVGQWAPTFLILGLYNKMVKLHGSDAPAQ